MDWPEQTGANYPGEKLGSPGEKLGSPGEKLGSPGETLGSPGEKLGLGKRERLAVRSRQAITCGAGGMTPSGLIWDWLAWILAGIGPLLVANPFRLSPLAGASQLPGSSNE